MIKKLIVRLVGKFALWLIFLLREAEKYSDEKNQEFMDKVDEAEKLLKEKLKNV